MASPLPDERKSVEFRPPTVLDGSSLWRLVRDTEVLEPNSAYAYLLLCRDFGETCLVAEQEGRLVAGVTAYRPPSRPESLFVWQIGVHPRAQGQGIGRRLLLHLLQRPACADVRYLEATVGVSNAPSQRLFRGVARALECPCEVHPWFDEGHFPPPEPGQDRHEAEPLYRIGPIRRPEGSFPTP